MWSLSNSLWNNEWRINECGKNGSIPQIAAGPSWESLHHSALNIDCMKAIDFFIAWGYIDFSLWLCFPQTAEEEKQLRTDAQIAQMFPQREGSKNRYLAGRSSRGRAVKSCRSYRSGINLLSDSSSPLLGCWGEDTCFLCTEGFDLFALASASSVYKSHEREWVIHLSVCMWVSICVR